MAVAAAGCMALAGCAGMPPAVAPADVATADGNALLADTGFIVAADRMDTWNAVGQLLVRTDDVQFEGRAEMLDLHAVRYRGSGLLVLTRAVPLSAASPVPAVRVSARSQDGGTVDPAIAGALLARLQAALPAEIARVRAVQAATAAAAEAPVRKAPAPARRTRRR